MRYRFSTLLSVLALGPPAFAQVDNLPMLGTWRIVAQEAERRIDDAEPDNEVVVFSEDELLCDDDGKPVKCKCSYDIRTKPMRVAWDAPEKDGMCVRGIWRIDGGNLQICARIGTRDKPPDFPKDFNSQKGDPFVKLLLFSRVTDDPLPP